MIKYFKFTDNIVSGNVTNTFFQNTNKFQKSVCLGEGGGRDGGKCYTPHAQLPLDMTLTIIVMVTRLIKAVTYCKGLPPMNLIDPSMRWLCEVKGQIKYIISPRGED